jgi:hypothetical protein
MPPVASRLERGGPDFLQHTVPVAAVAAQACSGNEEGFGIFLIAFFLENSAKM